MVASVEASARSPSTWRSSRFDEGARQIVVDETQRAAQALEADLDEDARGILDVVARGLHQPRHLPQLREHAPRALGERRVVEERLAGQAGRQRVGVELRAALPGADVFQLEDAARGCSTRAPGARDARCRSAARDRLRPAGGAKPPRVANLRVDRLPAEVLEQVVVHVHAVEGGRRRIDFV